jgi:hypothetical protein
MPSAEALIAWTTRILPQATSASPTPPPTSPTNEGVQRAFSPPSPLAAGQLGLGGGVHPRRGRWVPRPRRLAWRREFLPPTSQISLEPLTAPGGGPPRQGLGAERHAHPGHSDQAVGTFTVQHPALAGRGDCDLSGQREGLGQGGAGGTDLKTENYRNGAAILVLIQPAAEIQAFTVLAVDRADGCTYPLPGVGRILELTGELGRAGEWARGEISAEALKGGRAANGEQARRAVGSVINHDSRPENDVRWAWARALYLHPGDGAAQVELVEVAGVGTRRPHRSKNGQTKTENQCFHTTSSVKDKSPEMGDLITWASVKG